MVNPSYSWNAIPNQFNQGQKIGGPLVPQIVLDDFSGVRNEADATATRKGRKGKKYRSKGGEERKEREVVKDRKANSSSDCFLFSCHIHHDLSRDSNPTHIGGGGERDRGPRMVGKGAIL